jgi:hypothetical protein
MSTRSKTPEVTDRVAEFQKTTPLSWPGETDTPMQGVARLETLRELPTR